VTDSAAVAKANTRMRFMGPNPTLILGLVLYASVAQAQPSEHAQTGSYNKALGT